MGIAHEDVAAAASRPDTSRERKKEQAFGESIEWFEFSVKYPDSEMTPGQDESATNESQGKAPLEIPKGSVKRHRVPLER